MDDMVVLLYPIQVVVAEESGQTDQARALTSLIIVSPMWCLFARKFIEVASRDNRNVLTTDSSAQLPLNGNISSLASKGAIATGGMNSKTREPCLGRCPLSIPRRCAMTLRTMRLFARPTVCEAGVAGISTACSEHV